MSCGISIIYKFDSDKYTLVTMSGDDPIIHIADLVAAFKPLAGLTLSERNHAELTTQQITMIKTCRRHNHLGWVSHYKPNDLAKLTGLSVYRIQQIVNMKTPEKNTTEA